MYEYRFPSKTMHNYRDYLHESGVLHFNLRFTLGEGLLPTAELHILTACE